MASDKQVKYILHLLAQAGYSTRFMNRNFKELGATMRERSGSVENWVRSRNSAEASALIDTLKASSTSTEAPRSDPPATSGLSKDKGAK